MELEYDVFIEGLTIDLCIPTEEIACHSSWYSWFNQTEINKFLLQGAFPNTREQQRQWFVSESKSKERLILLIVTKSGLLKGVISLSKIDLSNRTATLALVIDEKIERKSAKLASLESVALITTHGFEVMRLDRIGAFQSRSLEGWQRRMELVGYRVEGIHKNGFIESRSKICDLVSIGCTYRDYKRIVDIRGSLFDDEHEMLQRIKKMPKISAASQLSDRLAANYDEYYLKIWK